MALDFGMALSKGLIAPQKSLQEEVRKLAGDQFKSEDWWNKQLDRQIKKGVTETKTKTQYLAETGSVMGFNQSFWADGSGANAGSVFGGGPRAARQGMFSPIQTRQVEYQEQRELGIGELKSIESQAKERTRLSKRATAQDKKGKRGARGSSGLMGRSTRKDEGLATGLPALGSLGLGIGKTKLG
tara:strand:+ start:266 stop:820 length:555 start_codon:yes stop_codon:yes gene_type:complete